MPLTSVLQSTRKADICFDSTSGRINISCNAVTLLDIHAGDSIDILADEWETFLICRHHPDGQRHSAVCYPSNKSSRCKHMRVSSSRLCRYMAKRFNAKKVRLSAENLVTLKDYGKALPLINRNLV